MTKKKSKRKLRSEKNKREFAEKRKLAKKKSVKKKSAKKPAAEKPAAEKPAIEKSDVETKPWPRAGDNKEFEEILTDFHESHSHPPKAETAESKEPEIALKTTDVAEWVKWPFQLWSTSQSLPPIILPNEALEVAEPLTRILNRHGVSERIPPDVLDGMQVVGRLVPVIKRGNDIVKSERKRRAKAGQGDKTMPGTKTPQGAPQGKPKEI